MRKTTAVIAIALILLAGFVSVKSMTAKAESGTIRVPDDYTTIQEAVNHAKAGETVFVKAGIYPQSRSDGLIIDRPLSLIGEDPETTIIDLQPGPFSGSTIEIIAANVTVSGFTIKGNETGIVLPYRDVEIQNCRITNNRILNVNFGIRVENANNFTIQNNVITGTSVWGINLYPHAVNGTITENMLSANGLRKAPGSGGILLYQTSNVVIARNVLSFGYDGVFICYSGPTYVYGNNITDNQEVGFVFGEYCNNAIVYGNNIVRNAVGMHLGNFPPYGDWKAEPGNMVYRNNLVDNSIQVQVHFIENVYSSSSTDIVSWDNGSMGNYWSDYEGQGAYVIDQNNVDNHPLSATVDISKLTLESLSGVTSSPTPTVTPTRSSDSTPAPTVPEFPSWIIPLLLIIMVVAGLLVYFKKHKHTPGLPIS